MFVGHLAVAFAAKKVEPRAPLWALVAATMGVDLLWPLLLLTGLEVVRIDPGNTAFTPLAFDSYPWSHSLAMALVWSVLAGVAAYVAWRRRPVAWLIAAVVCSHWVLDFITHRPDLPLWPGGPRVGLGLWNSIPASLIVEGGLSAAAIWYYARGTRAADRVGRWALWALVALTGVIWVSQPWSPPPPSATAVGATGLALWLWPAWAAWIDRHRLVAT
jgi:membrane-bound metal-dependent hydrolase YbcI (DUF457 family)